MRQTAVPSRDGIRTGTFSPPEIIVAMLWLSIAVWSWLWLGPTWVAAMRPQPGRLNDFYQDWGSARNYRAGLDIYTPHSVSIPRHLGLPSNPVKSIEYNAHPPTAVLFVLPLGELSFPNAVLVWNMIALTAIAVSLKFVADELKLPWTTLPPALALLAFCHPLYGNLYLGQLTPILVLLVTVIWMLERSGRSNMAGFVIGAVAAIKLFPAYLIIFYIARGRIQALGAAVLSFLALTLTAAFVLGPDSYHDYVRIVIPKQAEFWSCGYNLSLAGFWHKLFNPIATVDPIQPLWSSPALARWGTLVSVLTVSVVVAVFAHRAKTSLERDLAFGATVTAMLLVSPVSWDYSLPLLLVPIALIARCADKPEAHWMLAVLALFLTIDWVPQSIFTQLAQGNRLFTRIPWTFILARLPSSFTRWSERLCLDSLPTKPKRKTNCFGRS